MANCPKCHGELQILSNGNGYCFNCYEEFAKENDEQYVQTEQNEYEWQESDLSANDEIESIKTRLDILEAENAPNHFLNPNIYKYGDMRAWLNEEFYRTVFNEYQRAIIETAAAEVNTRGMQSENFTRCAQNDERKNAKVPLNRLIGYVRRSKHTKCALRSE